MFGIDMGPSSGEYGATNALTGESGFAGSMGEGLISNSSALINGLLSGNQSDIAKLLAPQIGAISKQANEKTQTNADICRAVLEAPMPQTRTRWTLRGRA